MKIQSFSQLVNKNIDQVDPAVSPGTLFSMLGNREVYERVYDQITTKYSEFDSVKETGLLGTDGLTASIGNISKRDLIACMMHIRDNDTLFRMCRDSSRTARLFDKFYLINDKKQGWNLRLHVQYVGGNGLEGEDPPHYHRWTLASRVLSGGYCNRNYRETSASGVDSLHVYDKYQLEASSKQISDSRRMARLLGKAAMLPVHAEVFDRDSLNHFPFRTPHSVQAKPDHFGSTVTLAHSSAPYVAYSTSFLKPAASGKEFTELSEIKSSTDPNFLEKFDQAIAFVQVLDLQDNLIQHFENAWEQGRKLTPHEAVHHYDSYEPNYVETSLLSALHIYLMEKEHNMPHREFSASTVKLLDQALAYIKPDALRRLIVLNQHNLALNTLSSEKYANNSLLMEQLEREFVAKLQAHQTKKT